MPGKHPIMRITSRCGPVTPSRTSIHFDVDCRAWSTAQRTRMNSRTRPSRRAIAADPSRVSTPKSSFSIKDDRCAIAPPL